MTTAAHTELAPANKATCAAGADDVILNDNRGSGFNIPFEQPNPRCRIIHDRNVIGHTLLPLLDHTFDAPVLVGMNARPYQPACQLTHR